MDIKINVDAKCLIPISDLKPFQGNLKTLSDENYEKLKKEIIEDGFNFAPHIWQNGGNNWILDGHQRIAVVTKLISEGFKIEGSDKLPCATVKADSYDNAKRKVLQAVSQYGKIDKEGYFDFVEGVDLDYSGFDLNTDFDPISPSDDEDPSFEFNDKTENDSSSSLKLIVELTTVEQQEDLFAELKERGFKVKASE